MTAEKIILFLVLGPLFVIGLRTTLQSMEDDEPPSEPSDYWPLGRGAWFVFERAFPTLLITMNLSLVPILAIDAIGLADVHPFREVQTACAGVFVIGIVISLLVGLTSRPRWLVPRNLRD